MTWTAIADIITIKPSEQLRKLMPYIDWDAVPEPIPRKHWHECLEGIEQYITEKLEKWQYVNLDPNKLQDETSKHFAERFELCRDNGWFHPQVIDGQMTFKTIYLLERHRTEWDRVEELCDDFVHEEGE